MKTSALRLLLPLVLLGCNEEHRASGYDLGGQGGGEDLSVEAPADLARPLVGDLLLGVWQVSGSDARGPYSGQLELRGQAQGPVQVIRVVRYADAKVEDDRELWWVWTGTATTQGGGLAASISLRRADFVRSRGGVTRTDADRSPLPIAGAIDGPTGGTTKAHWTAEGMDLTDTLTARMSSGAQPIFAYERTLQPVSAAPSAGTKAALFALYASHHARPDVMPYVNDPSFQAGVVDVAVDWTDLEFYRSHPRSLRVLDKVIDAPSLGETLARANAFSQTLAQKAAIFDAETPSHFIDSLTGQLYDSTNNGIGNESYDGALWTATYVASQAFRYLVTGEEAALDNVEKSVVGLLILTEITPDQTQFARTLRPATSAPTGGWHTGLPPYQAFDWREAGNNDMFKGIFYGPLMAWIVLCDPVKPGKQALCDRIATQASHLKDLSVVGGNTDNNRLMARWLSAYTTGSFSDYADAVATFNLLKSVIADANFQMRAYSTADFSGTHLGFVQMIGLYLLSQRAPLPGTDTLPTIKQGISKMRDDFQPFRMGLWSVLFAQLANSPSAVDAENARGRLREFTAPKAQLEIDHRVGAGFVMSPYPDLPWKNDWATENRTASLHGYPMFENELDVYVWRSGPCRYLGNSSTTRFPGADYLHAYWMGRYLSLFSATE